MTLTVRVLIGLCLGLLLGLLLSASESAVAGRLVAVLVPVGTLFVNLIRMTAIPLVASMLIASLGAMASADGLGRLTGRALGIATAMLMLVAVISAVVARPVFARFQIDRSAALALERPASPTGQGGTVTQWVTDLVPQNVVKAAADGAVLPVIVFSVLFGVALARVSDPGRSAAVAVAEGLAAAMQRIVGWVLRVAPLGVFALAVPLAAHLGVAAAGAVLAYIALVVVLTVVAVGAVLYPTGILASRMSARTFITYCAPGQAIGFASRSSLAALPAMMASAERNGLGPAASRFMLPLLASVFHFGAAIQQTVGVLFLAKLSGVSIDPWVLASVIVAIVFATYAVPSIPGGSIIALVPVLGVAGLPAEGIGILLAVDTIPDMFRTTANLTGAMTLAAVLDGRPPQAR